MMRLKIKLGISLKIAEEKKLTCLTELPVALIIVFMPRIYCLTVANSDLQ